MTSSRPPAELVKDLHRSVTAVIHGQDGVVNRILAAMIAGGHVLLEDVPGTGKTTLAKALARSIHGAEFKRLQFTPDLLPSDVLGVSILDPRDNSFQFHPGPIFTNVLLVDEINRASPRTQSALLEAMAEGQATVEGTRRPLHEFFFVIATQNPIEFRGTYPLPEAQMDRFSMQCALGYVTPDDEVAILAAQAAEHSTHPVDRVTPVIDLSQVIALRAAAAKVRVSDEIRRYIVDLIGATRGAAHVQLAASPRASIALMKTAQALAMMEGLEFVTPDHVNAIAPEVVAHRLVLEPQAGFSGLAAADVVREIIDSVPKPV